MKKIMFGLFALLLCMGMTSCKDNGNKDKDKDGDKKEVKEADADTDIDVSLPDLVAKAKAEGANWSVDEWKACLKEFFRYMNAVSKENEKWKAKIRENPDKEDELQEQADEALEQKIGDLEKYGEELTEIGEKCENFKKLEDDKAFQEELEKEFPYIPRSQKKPEEYE